MYLIIEKGVQNSTPKKRIRFSGCCSGSDFGSGFGFGFGFCSDSDFCFGSDSCFDFGSGFGSDIDCSSHYLLFLYFTGVKDSVRATPWHYSFKLKSFFDLPVNQR